jgi:hypothetical protein
MPHRIKQNRADASLETDALDGIPPVAAPLLQRMKQSDVLRRVYERVISLVTRIDSDTMEMYSAIVALGWALCLLGPGEYLTGPDSSPRLAPMTQMAPEWAWGLFFLVGSLWQLVTIVGVGLSDPPGRAWSVARIGGQCVAVGAWTFLGLLLVTGGAGLGMGTWMFLWMAGFLFVGLVKSAFAFRVTLEYRGYKRMQEAGKELPPAPPPKPRRGALIAGAGECPAVPPPGPAEYFRIGVGWVRDLGHRLHRGGEGVEGESEPRPGSGHRTA